jgi:hypothetical protein
VGQKPLHGDTATKAYLRRLTLPGDKNPNELLRFTKPRQTAPAKKCFFTRYSVFGRISFSFLSLPVPISPPFRATFCPCFPWRPTPDLDVGFSYLTSNDQSSRLPLPHSSGTLSASIVPQILTLTKQSLDICSTHEPLTNILVINILLSPFLPLSDTGPSFTSFYFFTGQLAGTAQKK